jgi:hypothetical protein
MWKSLRRWLVPVPEYPAPLFYFRLLLIILQIMAAYALSEKASPFFYQGF